MRVKTLVKEDFVNYRKPAMFIGTISCDGKCCTEAGLPLSVCQNDVWRVCAPIEIADDEICRSYLTNGITQAIVFGGLEPVEQAQEILALIKTLREEYGRDDDVVIYTGFYPHEIPDFLTALREYPNIVVKFGRFVPGRKRRLDEVLGVELSSDNQFAERIS